MPFRSRRAPLQLTEEDRQWLQHRSQSRSEPAGQVQRAQVLLRYHGGATVSAIAAQLRTNRPKVERVLAKALALGVRAALADLPGRGRRPTLTPEARAWVVQLACQKPTTLGYAQELWTTRLLAKHVREHGAGAGHPSLRRLGRGTVSKLLRAQALQPHKVRYYLDRRDPEFEPKMQQVLHVYQTVELWRRTRAPADFVAVLEAPPSTPSLFSMEGTDSATMETVNVQHEADRHADAGELRRQQARRDAARGAGPRLRRRDLRRGAAVGFPIAGPFQMEDLGPFSQPVQDSVGHGVIGEDLIPFPERPVRGDHRRLAAVMAGGDHLEHEVALRLAQAHVPNFVQL